MNPYIFNFFNGVIITILGFWSFSQNWSYAIYFIALGVILTILSFFVRKSHKMLGGVAMFSTIISTIVFAVLLFVMKDSPVMSLLPIAMMATSGFVTSLAFIQCAFNHQNEEACCVQPKDGTACCDKTLVKGENAQATGCC